MRRRLARTRVSLQPEYLPSSAENTELNYRTRVTTGRRDTATTLRLVSILTLLFIAIAFIIRLFTILPLGWGMTVLGLFAGGMLGLAYAKFLQVRPPWSAIAWCLGFLGSCIMLGIANYTSTPKDAYLILFGFAVICTATLAHLITRQICFWMSVNERIRLRKVRRWQRYWHWLPTWKTPRRCPEVAAYRLSFLALGAAFAFGYAVLDFTSRTERAPHAATFGVIGFLFALPLLWAGMNELGLSPPTDPVLAGRIAWKSLRTFVCYNRHEINAAGVFRFPDKFLRPKLSRDVALGCALALLTMALVAVSTSSPRVYLERYLLAHAEQGATRPMPKSTAEPVLSPSEKLFISQLPSEKGATYLEAKRAERAENKRAPSSWWEGIWTDIHTFLVSAAVVLLLCWLGPFALLLTILWFVGGRLLTAYYLALEAPDAYERPYQPTKWELAEGMREVTPWDNRIERMMWSNDPLETEHFYLGTSIAGDYPFLLHEELVHRHAHILGDTGSRKTSIGVAPLLTQLIARESCSVLIIDLKGDRSLFEAAREEAGAAGIPFKWFTNITGFSSFVFNPLRQSHVPFMTTNQLTQGILQALSLEYGEDYGRGYFSALNELVLATYMKHHRRHIGSFKELHKFVSDRDAYRAIGSLDDWEKTRHLASIVDKLAQVEPLNVVAEDFRADPRAPVIDHQIDLPSMLSQKQVIYFYLSSAQEQTTVPKIAKLALFSLLTAASRRGKGEKNRVYVFVDEFQRVISDNIRIFLEQARSMKLHFILANQTIGQLDSNGADLTDVVESCTAFKQSFRATDMPSIRRLMETSGEALYHSLSWTQLLNDAFDEFADDDRNADLLSLKAARKQTADGLVQVNVSESVGPRLEKNTIIEVSALPLASFVRCTEMSGYTAFSGYWTTVLSEYHITKALYGIREDADWPGLDEQTLVVTPAPDEPPVANRFIAKKAPIPKPKGVPEAFEDDLEKRLDSGTGKTQDKPPNKGNTP